MNAADFTAALDIGAHEDRRSVEARLAARLLSAANDLAAALAPGDGPRQERISFAIARLAGKVSIDEIARMRGMTRADVARAIKDVIEAREAGRAFDAAMNHAMKAMIHVRLACAILETNP